MDTNDVTGLITCAKYAFAPNFFSYCGPDKNRLLGQLLDRPTDGALPDFESILNGFDTVRNYLEFIAGERGTGIYDDRVVRAYFLGNNLTGATGNRKMYELLTGKMDLKRKMKFRDFSLVTDKLDKMFPHHNFHVLNVFCRTGHIPGRHTLATMDECRISWGRVASLSGPAGGSGRVTVRYQPLTALGGRISLGPETEKTVESKWEKLNIGDIVSLHWSHVCEKISPAELARLKRFTTLALRIARY